MPQDSQSGPMYPESRPTDPQAAEAAPERSQDTEEEALDEPTQRAIVVATAAPDFVLPWLDRFYDATDAELVLGAANRARHAPSADPHTLERAVRRAVLDRDPAGLYTPSSFHARFEMWALFEGWLDVPASVRRRLNEWELADYIRQVGPGVEAVRDDRPERGDQGDYTFLLLQEAEALIRSAPHVYLWPCNCRAMWGNCAKELNVCLRFDNARNVGWEVNADHALAVLRDADRKGLTHTAYNGTVHGHHGICNCCADCCFPLVSADRLGAADKWPVRRHLAAVDPGLCEGCGRCTRRCPFGAVARPEGRKTRAAVDERLCRGCGLCATGCTHGAMAMMPLT